MRHGGAVKDSWQEAERGRGQGRLMHALCDGSGCAGMGAKSVDNIQVYGHVYEMESHIGPSFHSRQGFVCQNATYRGVSNQEY